MQVRGNRKSISSKSEGVKVNINVDKKQRTGPRPNNHEFNVLFTNVDVFTYDKFNELKLRIGEEQTPPSVIVIQEDKPKLYRYEREIVEYKI